MADGALVRRGDPVGELHYWNEHMPALAERKPALAWALAADRAVRRSLRELAEFVESDPRYREVRAITGEMGGLPIHGARMLAAAGSRLGFEPRPVEPPRGPAGRLRRWGEDMLLRLLAWGYNPVSLRRRGARSGAVSALDEPGGAFVPIRTWRGRVIYVATRHRFRLGGRSRLAVEPGGAAVRPVSDAPAGPAPMGRTSPTWR